VSRAAAWAVLVLLPCSGLAAQATLGAHAVAATDGTAPTLRDRVVAVVDDDPILQSDVERAVALAAPADADLDPDTDPRRRALDGLIEQRLRIHEVERYGFAQVPVERIRQQVDAIRARFPSPEAFAQRLAALGMDMDGLEQLVAQQLQVMIYVDELLGARVFVGLEEIEAYYERTLAPQLRAAGQQVPPLEDVREQIREVLRQQRLNQELERWTGELRRNADVRDFLDRADRPLPPVVAVRPEGKP
jgi:hypothetical protein